MKTQKKVRKEGKHVGNRNKLKLGYVDIWSHQNTTPQRVRDDAGNVSRL